MLAILKNKQIAFLFLSSFAVLFTGMGLFPILPLFAAKFQASSSMVGLFLAVIYAANALGPAAAGWLIGRFSKRAVFVAGGLVGTPALVMLALAQDFTTVIAAASLVWFSGGVVMALVSIYTGLHADSASQGKAYSLMGMVGPLGALVGGGTAGWLVTVSGYPVLFLALAGVWSIIPLVGLLGLKDPRPAAESARPAKAPAASRAQGLAAGGSESGGSESGGAAYGQFIRLLAVVFLGSVAVNVSRFGSSLSMQAGGFSAQSVSSAAMVSGLAAIPITLAIGSLSDRLGRKQFLVVSYLFGLSGALVLASADQLWQYWLASVLTILAYSVSGAMSQAVTGEVVPERSLGQGLAWLNSIGSVASIAAFAVSGLLFDLLGLPVVFLLAALAALAASAGLGMLVHTETGAAPALAPEPCPND